MNGRKVRKSPMTLFKLKDTICGLRLSGLRPVNIL
jgi:hypothetical protein